MKAFTHQAKRPKPQPVNQCLARFERELKQLGYVVNVQHGSGLYAPNLTISVWEKRDAKEAQA